MRVPSGATVNCVLASGCMLKLTLRDTVLLRTANPVGSTQPIRGRRENAQGITSIIDSQGRVSGCSRRQHSSRLNRVRRVKNLATYGFVKGLMGNSTPTGVGFPSHAFNALREFDGSATGEDLWTMNQPLGFHGSQSRLCFQVLELPLPS